MYIFIWPIPGGCLIFAGTLFLCGFPPCLSPIRPPLHVIPLLSKTPFCSVADRLSSFIHSLMQLPAVEHMMIPSSPCWRHILFVPLPPVHLPNCFSFELNCFSNFLPFPFPPWIHD